MKAHRILSILFSVMIVSQLITAQTQVGIQTGLQISNMRVSGIIPSLTPDVQSLSGYQLGIVANTPLASHVSFRPELNLQERGFAMHVGTEVNLFAFPIPVGVTAVTKVRYLEIPLMLEYQNGNDKIQWQVFGGPTIAYALNGRLKTIAHAILDFKLYDTSINLSDPSFNRWDNGIKIGGGISFPIAYGKFQLNASYELGLGNALNLPVVDVKLKNQGFGIQVGYSIPL